MGLTVASTTLAPKEDSMTNKKTIADGIRELVLSLNERLEAAHLVGLDVRFDADKISFDTKGKRTGPMVVQVKVTETVDW